FDQQPALVPSELRFGVLERVIVDGTLLVSAKPPDLQSLVQLIARTRPDSIAICLIFAFANNRNERLVESACRRLRLPLSSSHRILPEFREYERTSTTVINAYLQPVMQRYLTRIAKKL